MKTHVRNRIKSKLEQFTNAIRHAISTKASEAETVAHIRLFLYEAMGYDFVKEISSEERIQGHFCDLAIKVDKPKRRSNERIQYLIEVKPAKAKLDHNNIFQAKAYGINANIDWIVLTNGGVWRLYKINRSRKKGEGDDTLLWEVDLLDPAFDFSRNEPFFDAISREGLLDGARERLVDVAMENITRDKALSPTAFADVVMSEPVIAVIRRELRRRTNVLLPLDVVADRIRNDVLSVKPSYGADAFATSAENGAPCDSSSKFEWKYGTYRIEGRGVVAEGTLDGSGFTVRAGTKVARDTVKSFWGSDKKKRESLESDGTIVDGVLTRDYTFSSASQAGGVLLGRSVNARAEWTLTRASE